MFVTSIFHLPIDCIQLILDKLVEKDFKSVSLTCQLFQKLTDEKCHLLSFLYSDVPSIQVFPRMLIRFKNLKRLGLYNIPADAIDLNSTLDLVACSGLDLEFLSLPWRRECTEPFPRQTLIKISSNMRSLKSLHCGNLVSNDDDLNALAEIFTDIEDLDMSNCDPCVTDEGFDNAMTMFCKLRRIDIGFNNQVSDSWLVSMSTHCPMLEEVICIPYKTVSLITDLGVCRLLGGCINLRRLVLDYVHFKVYDFHLPRAVAEAKKLRYLVIKNVTMLDKDSDDGLDFYDKGERISAAQIEEEFLAKWVEEHGTFYH